MNACAANWIRMCDASAVGDQEGRCMRIGGEAIAVFNLGGRYFAVGDRCPHGNASLSEGWVESGVVECPLHQAKFDIATGRVLCAPARDDLRTFDVKIEDGAIFVALDDANV